MRLRCPGKTIVGATPTIWKLREPDYNDEPEDECDHEDADVDVGDGRAHCRCGHSWYLSAAELACEHKRIAAYAEWEAEQQRPWNRFKEWTRGWWGWLKW